MSRLYSVGQVVRTLRTGDSRWTAKVQLVEQDWSSFLKSYFDKHVVHKAFLPEEGDNVHRGDTVLIKKLPKTVQGTSHQVEKVIFKSGYIVDPLTKRTVINSRFADESKDINEFVDTYFDKNRP